jgi:hypothetical protein
MISIKKITAYKTTDGTIFECIDSASTHEAKQVLKQLESKQYESKRLIGKGFDVEKDSQLQKEINKRRNKIKIILNGLKRRK